MKKKALQFAIGLLIISNGAFAQAWNGNDLNVDTYRFGNVGIGTTTPRAGLSLGAGNVGKRLLVYDNPATNVQSGFGIDMSNTGGRELTIFHPSNDGVSGKISFGRILESTGAYTETMRITGDGKVGIGTTNPGSFQLAVEGKIAAREILVTSSNNFPDYVFDSKYKLRNLSSLENYINQNKHLPNVPSAADVEKNGGIELGEMNRKLLEKVEELSLYIIEINKKVEKLEKENKAVKKRLMKNKN
ncbi:hypothetical protein A4D02_00865 [Niastella koreensis]|uniref:Uncharacterized protein n=2 Tax=Niastella koreensis TaxID=354356 RepID=G8TCK2_NIAKG|nr:tail fiber protein [Niastella koreensis]AEW02542.1 hypothetical protein Niako_6317 [Niastella koreensis GR20-10]OQP54906.1 hypothetical protein A4D02_00865 [Niastella koreensis]